MLLLLAPVVRLQTGEHLDDTASRPADWIQGATHLKNSPTLGVQGVSHAPTLSWISGHLRGAALGRRAGCRRPRGCKQPAGPGRRHRQRWGPRAAAPAGMRECIAGRVMRLTTTQAPRLALRTSRCQSLRLLCCSVCPRQRCRYIQISGCATLAADRADNSRLCVFVGSGSRLLSKYNDLT